MGAAAEPGASGPAVLVMARAPIPGRVKTRLEPVFTRAECAAIQTELIRRTARWAVDVAAPGAAYVALDPPEGWGRMVELVPPDCALLEQRGDHLGERLAAATQDVQRQHDGPLIVVGVDTRLDAEHAQEALDKLDTGADLALGPAEDGGYYLIALNRPAPEVFAIDPQAWGGPEVVAETQAKATEAGLTTAVLDRHERDLDTPADATHLAKTDPDLAHLLNAALTRPLMSVVVPTLDEATTLPALLDHLANLPGRFEVIVADGGSTDGTRHMAEAHPTAPHVLHIEGGRAAQLNAGASLAHGDPIVFLHADSRLPRDAYDALLRTHADGGNFAIRFDGDDAFSRILTAWYATQRRVGVYYGDSALWLRRATFESLAGFKQLPIMDDYDLARRLERDHRSACLPGPVTTSARRWRRLGVPRTVLSWVAIRWLFLAGVPPEHLARLYRRAR